MGNVLLSNLMVRITRGNLKEFGIIENDGSFMNNLHKLARSFKYAFQGMRSGFRTQLNFRVQCSFAVLAIMAGIFFDLSKGDWLWVILAIGLVLSAELVNTAMEGLVDLVSPEYNELAGRIKDIAAAAVTILALNALLIAAIIFIPPVIQLLKRQ